MFVANMIESYRSSSSMMDQMTKTPLQAQNEWICTVRRHQRLIEQQRRRRRRNIYWIVSSSSLMTNRTTKTPPQEQNGWIHIVFVIDNKENEKDSATGATMTESYWFHCHWRQSERQRRQHGRNGGRRTKRRCWSNVPCAMYWGVSTDDAIYVIDGATRPSNDNVECTKKHGKHENHERSIWVLCNWCMKERYDCYHINALK